MAVLSREALYKRRDETRAEETRLRDQRDRLLARAQADDTLTDPGVAEKIDRLTTGIERAEQQAQEAGRALITELAKDPANREEAFAPAPAQRGERTDPLDELRSAALRANDRAAFLPDNCRTHMEREVREDDSPDNGLARYITAAADRDYFRAFSKLFNDPVSGAHLWTPEEREAVQRVKTMQRSLTLSTSGTAGGFLRPVRTRSADPDRERRRHLAAPPDREGRHDHPEREAVRHFARGGHPLGSGGDGDDG
jgi:hypothetical protein